MSRKTTRWRRIIAQAGGNPDRVLPRRAVSRGRALLKTVTQGKVNFSRGIASGAVGTLPMRDEKEARFRGLA